MTATTITWKSVARIRVKPGRSPRSAYMLERANSSIVTRNAKATIVRVWWKACEARPLSPLTTSLR